MKRYCQTLELYDDPELIAAYVEEHRHVWDEIKEGQRKVGILDMQIYIHGTTLFMICDTVDDFDWVKDNERLAQLPRQAEWDTYVEVPEIAPRTAFAREVEDDGTNLPPQ